ncbi:MAG: sulfatase [Pirellulaceae bacterium]|nr:sulfatase [Pirellulaceae bacterium]
MRSGVAVILLLVAVNVFADENAALDLLTDHQHSQRNVIFILCDDHRREALGFIGHPFLETPHLDRMASGGAFLKNAFVTTSLCSPSRASILTGQYTHNHRVTDNYHPVSPDNMFFPQYLQRAGYETAFIGKWHMGGDDDSPRPGFDHWVAFKGQGTYWPDGHGTTRVVPQTRYDGFNVNGKRVPQKGYITDELTDYALDWLKKRNSDQPFFLYVSHKAVHSDFVPHDRHRGRYQDQPWKPPVTFADTPENRRGKPRWAINQRNSRHGTEYGYNLPEFDVEAYYKRYCESLLAVDDNVGRILDHLQAKGQLDSTIVIYMGDNGFAFGEHGLIDKRTAYESSIRVPLLVHCPDLIEPGLVIEQVVANIDIAPTLLEVAGRVTPNAMDGKSFYPLLEGKPMPWRDALLYEYFWEWNYPQTPTVHAVIGQRYKYIRYHGVWDTDELYDLKNDPDERRNLIRDQNHQELATKLKSQLFELLAKSSGENMPLLPDRGRQFYHRNPERSSEAIFPPHFYAPMAPVTK